MKPSIIVVGPQGCGKTINAPALAKAYGLDCWIDAEGQALPRVGHLILATEVPRNAGGIKVVQFKVAMRKLAKAHPATPSQGVAT